MPFYTIHTFAGKSIAESYEVFFDEYCATLFSQPRRAMAPPQAQPGASATPPEAGEPSASLLGEAALRAYRAHWCVPRAAAGRAAQRAAAARAAGRGLLAAGCSHTMVLRWVA